MKIKLFKYLIYFINSYLITRLTVLFHVRGYGNFCGEPIGFPLALSSYRIDGQIYCGALIIVSPLALLLNVIFWFTVIVFLEKLIIKLFWFHKSS